MAMIEDFQDEQQRIERVDNLVRLMSKDLPDDAELSEIMDAICGLASALIERNVPPLKWMTAVNAIQNRLVDALDPCDGADHGTEH